MKVVKDLSAGGVVYRHGLERIEFLVGEQIDWRTGDRNVRLPKGHLDPGESLEQAALREVAEETGRQVRLIEALGEHVYHFDVPSKKHPERTKHRVEKRVVFYLMLDEQTHSADRDDEMETLHWLSEEDACARLTFDNEREMIRLARRKVEAEG